MTFNSSKLSSVKAPFTYVNQFLLKNEPIYKAFVTYYENPKLTKIEDLDNYSVYISRVYCLLGNEKRYIIVHVDRNLQNIGDEQFLQNLHWISLQARNLKDDYEYLSLKLHKYQAKRGTILDAEIVKVKEDETGSSYKCTQYDTLNIKLLNKESNSISTYANKGSIISALETFSTVISFIL